MADDLYKYFRVEARELVESLGQGALLLDKGQADAGLVAKLLRHAHTLKGAARVVRQIELAELAHAIEELLAPHREAQDALPASVPDAVLKALDRVGELLELLDRAPDARAAANGPRAAQATPRAGAPRPSELPPADAARTIRAEVAEIERVLQGLGQATVDLTALGKTVPLLDRARALTDLIARQLGAPRRSDGEPARVALEKGYALAEDLRELFGELDRGFHEGVERLGRELTETHRLADGLRLVPVASMFTPLERAARDAAQELDKRVVFEATGGEVRLDGHVLGVVQEALFHAVRNAVVHGIEAQAERLRAGKPAHGRVRLEARRQGRYVTFACHDDGRGLDRRAVEQALIRRGLIAPAQGSLDDDALCRLLLQSRISTSERVTGVAGRGIGLDVLESAAKSLGGEARLSGRPSQGFSVELAVPVSVTAIEGLGVLAGGLKAVLPLDAVERATRYRVEQITRSARGDSVLEEGELIPFLSLDRVLGARALRSDEGCSAVVVRGMHGRAVLGVDRLFGTKTVVVQRLSEFVLASACVAGATLDPLGDPELVLDPDGLIVEARRAQAFELPADTQSRPILVIDDSLTTRMLEQSILEAAGYRVELATSGEDGLIKARAGNFGLFLVDVEMPGIDGFTFVERAQADAALKSVPAVLVSSRSAPADLARGQAVGARGYVVKDRFDQRELLDLIGRLVRN